MEINWEKVKMTNGEHFKERYVETPTGIGESFVNKGRKMLIVWKQTNLKYIDKKVRGHIKTVTQRTLNAEMYMDYGRVITASVISTVISERWTMPSGKTFTNKWQIYENE